MDFGGNVLKKVFEIKSHDGDIGHCQLVALQDGDFHFIYINRESSVSDIYLMKVTRTGEIKDVSKITKPSEFEGKESETRYFYRDQTNLLFYVDTLDKRKYLLLITKIQINKYDIEKNEIIMTTTNTSHSNATEDCIQVGDSLFATCSVDEKVNMFKLGDLSVFRNFEFGDEAHCLTTSKLHPNYLIAGGFGLKGESRIRVWNFETSKRILPTGFRLKHSNGIKGINTVVFQGNQEYVASFSWDMNIFFWNLETGVVDYQMKEVHRNIVEDGIFHRDRYLFSCGSTEMIITDLKNPVKKREESDGEKLRDLNDFHTVGKRNDGVEFMKWMKYYRSGRRSKKFFTTYTRRKMVLWDILLETSDIDDDGLANQDLTERLEYLVHEVLFSENEERPETPLGGIPQITMNLSNSRTLKCFKSFLLVD